MKSFGFWALFLMLGAALLCFSLSGNTFAPNFTDMASTEHEKDPIVTVASRKLKSDAGTINPLDYGPVDPVPSSKASVHSGPIQHGTPLMPYIPPAPVSP